MFTFGLTACEPLTGTVPIPEMVTLVAFWVDQESVEDCPLVIDAGFAVKNRMIGVCGEVVVIRTRAEADKPAELVTVSMNT